MKKSLISVLGLLALILFSRCENNGYTEYVGEPYNPNKKLALISFSPDSGGVAEQVILKGENFGTDKEKLRVYFNKKRAIVIETKGDVAYVVAPRLPGDTCIISVVIGKDSLSFKKEFYYKQKVHVITICGTPHADEGHEDGTLVEAIMSRPYYIAVDQEKNIFVAQYPNGISGSMHRIRMLNEEKNNITTIFQTASGGYLLAGCCSPLTQVIYFPRYRDISYIELNPEKQWAARKVTPTVKEIEGKFTREDLLRKFSFAVSPENGKIYTITGTGKLVSIDPDTHEAELVMDGILQERLQGGEVEAFLTFDPNNPHMLYFVNPNPLNPADEKIPGTDMIYTIDLRRNIVEPFAGSGMKGTLDGPRLLAQFNNPCQICFDKDGTLYVGDTDNYCVRKISKEGIVSTILGKPGTGGYMDGDPEHALFDRFFGMYIDEDGTLYIADYYNRCVRKLIVE